MCIDFFFFFLIFFLLFPFLYGVERAFGMQVWGTYGVFFLVFFFLIFSWRLFSVPFFIYTFISAFYILHTSFFIPLHTLLNRVNFYYFCM